jgi:hypothetical protein
MCAPISCADFSLLVVLSLLQTLQHAEPMLAEVLPLLYFIESDAPPEQLALLDIVLGAPIHHSSFEPAFVRAATD